MYCVNGHPMDPGQQFCGQCGAGPAQAPQAPQAPPAQYQAPPAQPYQGVPQQAGYPQQGYGAPGPVAFPASRPSPLSGDWRGLAALGLVAAVALLELVAFVNLIAYDSGEFGGGWKERLWAFASPGAIDGSLAVTFTVISAVVVGGLLIAALALNQAASREGSAPSAGLVRTAVLALSGVLAVTLLLALIADLGSFGDDKSSAFSLLLGHLAALAIAAVAGLSALNASKA